MERRSSWKDECWVILQAKVALCALGPTLAINSHVNFCLFLSLVFFFSLVFLFILLLTPLDRLFDETIFSHQAALPGPLVPPARVADRPSAVVTCGKAVGELKRCMCPRPGLPVWEPLPQAPFFPDNGNYLLSFSLLLSWQCLLRLLIFQHTFSLLCRVTENPWQFKICQPLHTVIWKVAYPCQGRRSNEDNVWSSF